MIVRAGYAIALFVSSVLFAACDMDQRDPCDFFGTGPDIECSIGDRVYDLHVPTTFGAQAVRGNGAALVIDMHGFGSSKAGQKRFSGWTRVSDEEGFVLITPQGVDNAWNGQLCCAFSNPQDDVAFLTAIVDRALASNRIDPTRVYATGLSNGGSMSHRLGCDAADVFAGIAPVSYQLMPNANGGCRPAMGLDVVHFHGTADTIVPFDTGRVQFPTSLPSIASNQRWADMLSCREGPTRTPIGNAPGATSFCDTFTGCADGAKVSLCTVVNGSHGLYPNSEAVDIPRAAWDFFEGR